jgi:hypothetical protein
MKCVCCLQTTSSITSCLRKMYTPPSSVAMMGLCCRRMSKRDAERLAREIWAAKDEAESAGAPRTHLADVTATFLERRYFAIPRLVTEVRHAAPVTPAGLFK